MLLRLRHTLGALALLVVRLLGAGSRDSRGRGYGRCRRAGDLLRRGHRERNRQRRLARHGNRAARGRSASPATGRSEGAEAALDRALADREVDVVLTLGILTSQQAARRKSLPKPVIAPLVIDPVLQGFPLMEGRSGATTSPTSPTSRAWPTKCARFTRSSASSTWWRWSTTRCWPRCPQLTTKATELAAALNVRIGIVRVRRRRQRVRSPAFRPASTRCT